MHILRTPRLFRSLHPASGIRPDVPIQPAPAPSATVAPAVRSAMPAASNAFFASVAHELRNAMGPLAHAIEILGSNRVDPDVLAQTLPMAQRQLGQMNRLVGDMLDMGRALNDCVTLEDRRAQPLQRIVVEVTQALGPEATHRRRQLSVAMPEAPLWVDVDRGRIAQSVTNLLSNALKFTRPGGHIAVAAWQDLNWVCLSVADDGVGIPQDQLEAIFEMFRQTETGKAHREGLGIGLALVRRYVDLHGGTVSARSAGPGQGSEFVVRLPLAKPPAAH